MSEFPKTLTIQQTYEDALRQMEEDGNPYDEDAENEDSIPHIAIEIGDSMEEVEIDSWDDIPEGYEPSDPEDRAEYYEHKDRKKSIW